MKSLSTAFLAQLTLPQVQPVFFVEIAFENETIYVWSGLGPFTPAGPATNPLSTFPYGTTFIGLGWLGRLSALPQTSKIQAQNITLALSGIPAELVTDAIYDVQMTGTATVWFGFMNGEGVLLAAADPFQMFQGALDVPSITDSGDTCTISITCENPLISLNLAPNRRFDDVDQQSDYPGDLGMSFVDDLENLQLYWPAPWNQPSTYPISLVLSPSGADIPVGGTVQIYVTLNYVGGSYYTIGGGSHSGSGPPWIGSVASSNPDIATLDPAGSFTVTGIKPGACLIVVKIPTRQGNAPTGQPYGEMRSCCNIIVHS